MFELFWALFLACSCPAQPHDNNGTVTTQNDTGGDGGHIPPPPIH
ncbi:MAG: hypothetical protein AAGC65_01810 [Mucilaginibacter sp.]